MSRRLLIAFTLVIACALPARAQHGGGAPRVQSAAPAEAAQFAFLIGQWELTVTPKATTLAAKLHGQPKLLGTWKAWQAFDGFGIEDELRIVDGSGNPMAFAHATRFYDRTKDRWTQQSLDVYGGRYTSATGEWKDGEMWLRSVGRDPEGNPYVQRTRFYDITATSFKYQTDRSTDGERSWETAVLRMDARRVAPTAPR